MSDRPTLHGPAWWAPALGRMTRRARIATAAIAVALLGIIYLVWISPAVSNAAPDRAPTAREVQLAKENAALQQRLWASEGLTKALRNGQTKAQAERKAQRAAKAAADAAKAQAAAAAKSATSAKSRRVAGRSSAAKASATTTGSAPRRPGTGANGGAANPTNPTQPAGRAAALGPIPTAPTKAQLLTPSARYFGMYTMQAPFSWAALDDTSAKVGRTPDMVGYFSGWDRPFRPDPVTRAWSRGMLPTLTWESQPSTAANNVVDAPNYSLPVILGDPAAGVPGKYDDYLRQYARDIKALGLPLAIRLDHEMNGTWYPWSEQVNGNNPGDFAKVWRHVHDIFEQEGANQYVIWTWAPNIVNNLPAAAQDVTAMASLYPGDGYVDWVGLSGYYRPPYKAENNATFEYTFDRSLTLLRQVSNKPIILAEVGASEVGGRKPEWVRSFFSAFARPENADIIGFSWFNLAVTTSSQGALITNDWRIDSRRNSLDAFTAGISDPANRFGGAVLPGPPAPAPDPVQAESTVAPTPTPTPTPTPERAPTPSSTGSPTPEPTDTTEP